MTTYLPLRFLEMVEYPCSQYHSSKGKITRHYLTSLIKLSFMQITFMQIINNLSHKLKNTQILQEIGESPKVFLKQLLYVLIHR
jgi:hypothetical protein